MRDPIAVTKEAVVVGASLLVVGSLLMAIDFKGKDHPAWPYLGTFIAGFATQRNCSHGFENGRCF